MRRMARCLVAALLMTGPAYGQTILNPPGTGGSSALSLTAGTANICLSPSPIVGTGTISGCLPLGNSGANISGASYAVNLTPPGDLGTVLNFTGTGASAWTLGSPVYGDGIAVVNSGTASITITATGNINGNATLVLAAGTSASIYNDGSTWWAAVASPAGGNANFGTATGNTSGDHVCMANTTVGVADCGVSASYKSATIGWIAAVNPTNAGVIILPANATLVSIVGNVETAVGASATVSVNLASSGTACSAGTTVHSGSFNANGTAATNQTLTLTTTAVSSGQRLCLQTTGTTSWTSGTGVGTLTVTYTTP